MLAEQRQSLIAAMVNQRGSLSITELQRKLKVSRETIRRDVMLLADRNVLRKTYGGALSLEISELERKEPELAVREVSNAEAKRAIGRRAAELVPDGATVILSSGSTPQSVAEALLARQALTVYSNSLVVCATLANRNKNRVFVLGGEIQANNNSTLGHDAVSVLSNYHADFAFVGAGAVSPDGWVMDYTRDEAELHRLMLRSVRTAAIVADYSKFNRHAPIRVANFEKITHLITDRRPDGPLAQALAALPLDVLITDGRPQ